jgi:uncharacterized membrane protein
MNANEEIKDAPNSPAKLASESRKKFDPQKKPETASVATFASYSGPIPSPNFLIEYERMVPGIAEKFLNEPHLEAEHRRTLEKMMAEKQIDLADRGQKMAFALASLCVIGAFGAIFFGHSLEGLGALIASIAVFAGIFYCAKKK